MSPADLIRSEPVVFDDVEEGDWVVPVWPGPEWPPMRAREVNLIERVIVMESVIAPTVGKSMPHVHIVTEELWNSRGASRFQWLRLPGLREVFDAR